MVMDQGRTNARNLVRADRGPHATAADGHAALERPRRHRLGERDNEVGIVVVRLQRVGAEIDDVVSGSSEPCDQLLFRLEPALIGGNSHLHGVGSAMVQGRAVYSELNRAASASASTTACC